VAEYALILGGIAIVVILALVFLGGQIYDLFESTGSSVNAPV
jgi:Flp pilus assembly pilin Flp